MTAQDPVNDDPDMTPRSVMNPVIVNDNIDHFFYSYLGFEHLSLYYYLPCANSDGRLMHLIRATTVVLGVVPAYFGCSPFNASHNSQLPIFNNAFLEIISYIHLHIYYLRLSYRQKNSRMSEPPKTGTINGRKTTNGNKDDLTVKPRSSTGKFEAFI